MGFLYLLCLVLGSFPSSTSAFVARATCRASQKPPPPQPPRRRFRPILLAYSASDLLYDDQQEARARRAAAEEELLGTDLRPLDSFFRSSASATTAGSGFGKSSKTGTSASKGKRRRSSSQRLASEQAKVIHRDGVLKMDGVLSDDACDRLLRHVLRQQQELAEREAPEEGDESGNDDMSTSYYGVENRRKKRCDLLLSLQGGDGVVPDVLRELLGARGTLRPVYEELVTNDGELYELAAVVTEPGSDRQQVHPDLPYRTEAPLYVVFLALQDVTEAMGPTSFLLGSQKRESQIRFHEGSVQRDELLSEANSDGTARLALLKKGEAVLFDARILHCGNANQERTGSTRALFNFSFRNPRETGNLGYRGSMRPGYVEALTLGDIGAALSDHRASGEDNPFEKYGDGLMRG